MSRNSFYGLLILTILLQLKPGVSLKAEENVKLKKTAETQQKGAREQLPELQLESVIESVHKNHPIIIAASEQIENARGALLASQGAFDRVARGEVRNFAFGQYTGSYMDASIEQPFELYGMRLIAGARRGTGSFPIYDDYLRTNEGGEIRTGLELPLLRNRDIDQRRADILKADNQGKIAELNFQARKISLLRSAGTAYLDWLASYNKLKVFEELLRVAQERNSQFKRRTQAGDLARFDQVDNERQMLQRETQLLSAQRTLANAEYQLSLFYRDDDGVPNNISDYSPAKTVPALAIPENLDEKTAHHKLDLIVAAAFQDRPDLASITFLKEQVKADLSVAENNLMPQLDLLSYLSRDLGNETNRRDETELNVGLKIELPIQTRSQEGKIKTFKARLRELSALEGNLKDQIRTEVMDTINALKISKDRARVASEERKLAQELERGENNKFIQGDSNLIFINIREQTSSDAAIREIDSVLAYRKAITDYYASLGRELGEDL